MRFRRVERGWAGHYICGDRCMFHRNTLLVSGDIRIIVSTVGNQINMHKRRPWEIEIEEVGCGRYYETMVFHAKEIDGFWEIDVFKELPYFRSLSEHSVDYKAEKMHEDVIKKIREDYKE